MQREPNPATLNLHPAYASLLISFNPLVTHPSTFEEYVRAMVEQVESVELPPVHAIEIPVCYDAEFAPDLEFVARHASLSATDVVRRHSSLEYLVYFVGFSPGFAYLGDLPRELAVPRLPTPRLTVPAGSVALGGQQTGVYSVSSPGGWRIIGRTPVRLFDPDGSDPTLLHLGDVVRFRQISKSEYSTFNERHE
jgi:inhibitor of KinA